MKQLLKISWLVVVLLLSSNLVLGYGYGGGHRVEDISAPEISQIEVTVFASSAEISWQTDESSITWFSYGLTSDYTEEIKTTDYSTSHSVSLTGLSPNTTYHYRIKSKDRHGNMTSTSDRTFTTLEEEEEVEEEKPPVEKPITEMTLPELKAKLVELTELVNKLRAKLLALVAKRVEEIPSDYKFVTDLYYGQRSIDVRYLQIFLKSQGPDIYPEGLVTGYFGPLTRRAIIRFQEKYRDEILAPWGLTYGTGFVGRTTRAKINQILGR